MYYCVLSTSAILLIGCAFETCWHYTDSLIRPGHLVFAYGMRYWRIDSKPSSAQPTSQEKHFSWSIIFNETAKMVFVPNGHLPSLVGNVFFSKWLKNRFGLQLDKLRVASHERKKWREMVPRLLSDGKKHRNEKLPITKFFLLNPC